MTDNPTPNAAPDEEFQPFAVCVYCGSRPGGAPRFVELAAELGTLLAREELRLVYGAGDLGLMGAVSSAARDTGGDVLGVIPQGLFKREIGERAWPGVIVTENLHQRKALMLANSDAAIVLPGGVGTLDEFIEAATWRHLGIHNKPIILLDPDGYWDPMMQMFDRMRDESFLWNDFAPEEAEGGAERETSFEIARTPADAIARIRRAWAVNSRT